MRSLMFSNITCIILALFICGCTANLKVTSDPPGGTIEFAEEDCGTEEHCWVRENVGPVGQRTPAEVSYGSLTRQNVGYLRVVMEGHQPSQPQSIGVKPYGDHTIHFTLTSTVVDRITSYPPGASIYWGPAPDRLFYSGFSTPLIRKVTDFNPEGKPFYVTVRMDGYERPEPGVPEQKGDERAIHFILKQIGPKRIKETITSDPPGAKIYVSIGDNEPMATGWETPHTIYLEDVKPVLPERHFQVKKDGYRDSEVITMPETREDRLVHFDLVKMDFGYIRLTSNMGGIEIYLNGESHGKTSSKKPMNLRLQSGDYTITAKKDNFIPATINVNLKNNDVLAHHIDLKQAKFSEEGPEKHSISRTRGSLTVVTSRNDLTVVFEGTKLVPSFQLNDVGTGVHDLLVLGPGIKKKIKVTVKDKENQLINLDEMKLR